MIGFPFLNSLIRLVKAKPVTLFSIVVNIIAGFGATPFLFMALSPFDPELLTRIPDKDLLLCLLGFLGLVVCSFALFEKDT